jgi:hypothetical protein
MRARNSLGSRQSLQRMVGLGLALVLVVATCAQATVTGQQYCSPVSWAGLGPSVSVYDGGGTHVRLLESL